MKDYLKEELWPGLWLIVWGVLWFQYYDHVNPYNSTDQLILAVISLLVLMNILRECRVRINNILFLSVTWLMLIYGALMTDNSYEGIQAFLGFFAFLFLFRILLSRKEFVDEITDDARINDVTVELDDDNNGEIDKSDESKQ